MSPMPWSRMISLGARESMHDTTAANGYWPVDCGDDLGGPVAGLGLSRDEPRVAFLQTLQRFEGDIEVCDSFVWT